MGKNADAEALLEQQSSIESRWAYEGKFLRVRHDVIKTKGQPPKVWDIVTLSGAVAVVPINEKGDLVLVEQWRRAIGQVTLEIPAGKLELREDPAECAQRELQEETGFLAKSLYPFGGVHTSPAIVTEYISLFLAKDLVPSPLLGDDTHAIDTRTVSLEEALKMISRGEITDSKTIVGILRYAQTTH